MAYSINPCLPKARATAMKLLIADGYPSATVANKCGVHRTTIWRWKKKWDELNKNVQFDNPNRPSRPISLKNKLSFCTWRIPTLSSRPATNPKAIAKDVVDRIMELRKVLKRCAEVIWHHINFIDGIRVSLSSVRRTLKRHYAFDGARKNRVRPDNPRRPHATKPGELVQTDTVHYVCPHTKRRRYVYTVIDLHSRMAYAEIHNKILPGIAANVIDNASIVFGFKFSIVQADNGPEFSRYFEQRLKQNNIQIRHSRLGRPNDNAHIERFNRTIQDEALGRYITSKDSNESLQRKIYKYISYYNNKRVHLGIQLKTPAEMLQRS